jgi:hypothetical protein
MCRMWEKELQIQGLDANLCSVLGKHILNANRTEQAQYRGQ